MKVFKQRRAVTPLMATLVLIVLAIGLGATVMSWGSSQMEFPTEIGCPVCDCPTPTCTPEEMPGNLPFSGSITTV